MNIETANRLYQYRKNMGISQEELAEKIGVSLDELLSGKRESSKDNGSTKSTDETSSQSQDADDPAEGVHVNVSDGKDRVKIGLDGIHINAKDGTKVSVDKNGVFVSEKGETKVFTDEDGHIHKSQDVIDKENEHKRAWAFKKFPYPVLAVIAYLLFGFFNVCGGWAYGWIVFLTVPLYYTTIEAIIKKDAKVFCYPVLVVIVFLILGFVWGLWHPAWIIFITVPIYYFIAGLFKKKKE